MALDNVYLAGKYLPTRPFAVRQQSRRVFLTAAVYRLQMQFIPRAAARPPGLSLSLFYPSGIYLLRREPTNSSFSPPPLLYANEQKECLYQPSGRLAVYSLLP